MRDSISRVEDDSSGSSRGVERELGCEKRGREKKSADGGQREKCEWGDGRTLDRDVEGRRVEGLKHDLSHLLPVGLRVERSLGEEDGMLLGSDSKLVVEGVVPDLLHVVPVGDDSMLDGIFESKDTSLGLSFIAGGRGRKKNEGTRVSVDLETRVKLEPRS